MRRLACSIALALLAAACAPDPAPTDVVVASLGTATTCVPGTVSTELHVDFPDGTALDVLDCFGAKGMGASVDAGADIYNGHYFDSTMTSPDGTTHLTMRGVLYDALQFQTGEDLSFPNPQHSLGLTLYTARGTVGGSWETIHLDEWKFPTLNKADGVLSATMTGTFHDTDGDAHVRLKVTGLVLDSWRI